MCEGKLRVRHIFFGLLFFFDISLSFAATCDLGYYLNENNECIECKTGANNNYYCPGDDTMILCPTKTNEYFNALANDAFGESIIISVNFFTWNPEGLSTKISNCYADVRVQTPKGKVLVEAPATQDYWGKKFWYKANPGYYLYDYYGWTNYYKTVLQCENTPPIHAYFSDETEPNNPQCAWNCDSGYGRTANDTCEQLCRAGITQLRTSNGLSYNLYANKTTTPSINIKPDNTNTVCYVNLAIGNATNTINVQYGNTVYHTTN